MPTIHTDLRLIATRAELQTLCDELAGADVLALDTEFIRERSYAPRLELVQVASRSGVVAAIDYGQLGRLEEDPFAVLLRDPQVLKVFHAAEQDLEVLQAVTGEVIAPMYDTQLASGLAGHGAKPGYGALVEGVLGKRLPKGESMTDWSVRPLTEAQLAYALDDVRYLLEVYDRLNHELEALGRTAWAQQECDRLRLNVEGQLRLREDPDSLYQRVRGRGSLDAQGLAILRELARWREAEAVRRDRPRGSILKDEILVEVSRRAPKQLRHLQHLRGIPPRDLERHGEALLEGVTRALALPRSAYPPCEPPTLPPDEITLALTDLLQAVTHTVASSSGIAATLLATNGDLQRLAEAYRRGSSTDVPCMEGWRGELLGDCLLSILEGRTALVYDPAGHALKLVAAGA